VSGDIWTIELLGPLCARRGEQIITRFRTQKTGALLAYLACQSDRALRRDELIDTLWPDNDPESGRNCLRISLNSLRQCFDHSADAPDAVIIADRSHVRLNPTAVTTDKEQFEAQIKIAMRSEQDDRKIEALAQAASLYRSDLLPDFDENWVAGERTRLMDAYLVVLRKLVNLVAPKDFQCALDYAKRAVQTDPLREESHRTLMQLYTAAGRPASALRQYRELSDLLKEELGTEPSSATRALVAQISADAEPKSAPAASVTVTAQAYQPSDSSSGGSGALTLPRPSSLPTPMTRFFGREECIGQVEEMFRTPETRLVTLTGLGGSGKTRLALATAEQMQSALVGAVFFVPLADINDAALIPDAILSALQLPRQGHLSALEQTVGALSHRATLLVLDNFEHLVEQGAPLLATLMARAPQLICLVTSRQRLNLGGEYEFAVTPLATPHTPGTPARLLEFACVQLFVDRARAVRPGFELDPTNAASVAALCHHLEGVPLAIELAAAYVQVMTPAQILARLTPRLKLLVSRARDAAPRHTSLRAALEWSFDLLSPAVQRFFARLSVFRGGWTLEAAEALVQEAETADPRDPLGFLQEPPSAFAASFGQEPPSAFAATFARDFGPFGSLGSFGSSASSENEVDALECLLQLRERSLVTVEDGDAGMRFGLLETVREFAAEKLSLPDREEATQAHREYHLRLAESARPHLNGPDAAAHLDRLETEQDNLRAALWYASREPLTLLRLTDALWLYWYIRGYGKEGSEWLERAITGCGEAAPPELRATTLMGAGNLAYGRKDLVSARRWFESRLALARGLGDVQGEASALGSLGNVANDEGDHERARALLTQCLAVFEQLRDARRVAVTKENLAFTSSRLGRYALAEPLHEESVAFFRSVGDKDTLALGLVNYTYTLFSLGKISEASASLLEGLILARDLKNRRCFMFALSNWVTIALARRAFRQATVAMGALEEMHARTGFPMAATELVRYERERGEALAALGEGAFSSALQQGRGMGLEQISSYAIEELKRTNGGADREA